MSHLVIARKYRPLAFDSVNGQEHVTRTLTHCIERDKIPHAILLTGPRGVGKTSIARIFAKCLNCEKGPTASPCLKCINCTEIALGNSTAVREIDGASHNSVDNVRELIDGFRTLPAPGSKYKVYIIDEVHMLSTAAFNALLKSLEEPPPHTVFILATTEVHKIPETVLSRCQCHDLKALPLQVIQDQIVRICDQEKVKIEPQAVSIVAQVALGSMRDAQTALERLFVFSKDSNITAKDAFELFGFADRQALFEITSAIISRDPKQCLQILDRVLEAGVDTITLIRDFVSHCRLLLIASIGQEASLKKHLSVESQVVEFLRQSASITTEEARDLSNLAREGGDQALKSSFPEYALEALLIRMASRAKPIELASVLNSLTGAAGKQQSSFAASASAATSSAATLRPAAQPTSQASVQSAAKPMAKDPAILKFTDFVSFASKKSRMLAEQLKRTSAASFSEGKLVLNAPEFSYNYFDKKENKDSLVQLLEEYSSQSGWKVSLNLAESNGGAALGSAAHMEASKQKKALENKENQIMSSPHIQAIQNLFPGSKIEVKS